MYTVLIYPGRAHWYKPIEELTESFSCQADAESYIRTIRKYKPNYYFRVFSYD